MIKVRIMYFIVINIHLLGKLTAALTFLTATVLLFIFPELKDLHDLKLSLHIIIIGISINILIGMLVIFCWCYYPFMKKSMLKILGIMLLNVPISILYARLIFLELSENFS